MSSKTAQQMYEFYLDAEMKLLQGQTVKYGDRMLTRADLADVQAGRREWAKAAGGKGHSFARFE